MNKKYFNLVILSVFIFVVATAVRYWPILHKGFSWGLDTSNLILARNLSLAGEYKIMDKMDIVLSSELVKEKGISYSTSNKLTPIIYSKIFDVFGFNPQLPLYVSLIIYGVTNILLFFLILKIFNIYLALIFSGIDIFMPFVVSGSNWFGFYEWAMLFFIIGTVIYLWKKKPGTWRLLLSGLFFGLAALARNAFLISVIPFLLYDIYSNFIYKKDWKQLKQWFFLAIKRGVIFLLPLVILWGGFFLQDRSLNQVNTYIDKTEKSWDGHLFTDPYTYRFEKEEFIREKINTAEGDEINGLIDYGYFDSIGTRVKMSLVALKYYLVGFSRQPLMGGSLILFFLALGATFLYKKNKQLFILPVFWIIFLFSVLIVLRTSNEDHFLEVRFPLVLMVSLGVFWLLEWLRQVIRDKKTYFVLAGAIILVLAAHLIQSNKWMFHENYLYAETEKSTELVDLIKKDAVNISINDVIAAPVSPQFLNYYTDYNYIYFNPGTIERLLEKNKLQWAFDQFGVTRATGFGELLNKRIAESTQAKIID